VPALIYTAAWTTQTKNAAYNGGQQHQYNKDRNCDQSHINGKVSGRAAMRISIPIPATVGLFGINPERRTRSYIIYRLFDKIFSIFIFPEIAIHRIGVGSKAQKS